MIIKRIIVFLGLILSIIQPSYAETEYSDTIQIYTIDELELKNLDEKIKLFTAKQDFESAILLMPSTLSSAEKIYGKQSIEYAYYLNTFSLLQCYINNSSEAIKLALEALNIYEKTLGSENLYYATALSNLALCYSRINNYEEAIKLTTKTLDIFSKVLGRNHASYIKSLSNLAIYNYEIKNYNDAKKIASETLEIQKSVLGETHPSYVKTLSFFANLNNATGDYNEAIRLYSELLELYASTQCFELSEYAKYINDLAVCYSKIGKFNDAIRLGTDAIDITEAIWGKQHIKYAISLKNCAEYNFSVGNYNETKRLIIEALNIQEKIQGKQHPDYAESLCILSEYYYGIGNYDEAIVLTTKVLNILEEGVGVNNSKYSKYLNWLAFLNSKIGNYAESIALGIKAMNIQEKTQGKLHSDYAESLCGLAVYNSNIGNYENSIKYATEAISIYEETIGNEHPSYATSLVGLATYNNNVGNYKEAINLCVKALDIYEHTIGKEHPIYATALAVLASSYSEIENYNESVRLVSEVLSIQKKTIGELHPDYATGLNNLSLYNFMMEDYEGAIWLSSKALAIYETTLGEKHPNYADILSGLAMYNYFAGDYQVAKRHINDCYRLSSYNISHQFSNLTSAERKFLWEDNENLFSYLIPIICFAKTNASDIRMLYNSLLFSKGILLNSEIEFSKLIAESRDEEVMNLYSELQSNRRLLNKLYETPIAERSINTDSLENECNSLERELIQKSKIYGDFTHNMNIEWEQVKSKLNDNDIAIEFVSFPTDNDSIMYCALTLKHGYESPRMIELFETEQLNNIDKEDYYETTILSKLVWGPLKEELDGAKNVYFAPAGELYNIAIESLRNFDGDGYVFDNWNLYRLSSTRELAIVKEKSNTDNVALYGGLIYDPDNVTFEKDTTTQNYYYAHTRSLPDSIGLRAGYDYLRGTLIEVEKIDSLYTNKHTPTTLFTDVVGTETSLKKLSGKKLSNLHISTHGFYWSESKVETDKDLQNLRFLHHENNPRYIEDKAMTRSGLLFAGANAILQGDSIPDNCDDGILTAQEIATLDFRGVDLLVLSACQTGLGEVKGDGVFGLQRGFKKAGVQTIVMSLWKVDDDASEKLMTTFYENLLVGKSKRESFLQAQKTVRETPGFEDPEYWAGFILLDALN